MWGRFEPGNTEGNGGMQSHCHFCSASSFDGLPPFAIDVYGKQYTPVYRLCVLQ